MCLLQYGLHECSVSVSSGTVVEYCTLEKSVSIGKNCIVSNLHVPADTTIPDGSFLHTVPVSDGEQTGFTTFAFGMKKNNDELSDQTDNAMFILLCFCFQISRIT